MSADTEYKTVKVTLYLNVMADAKPEAWPWVELLDLPNEGDIKVVVEASEKLIDWDAVEHKRPDLIVGIGDSDGVGVASKKNLANHNTRDAPIPTIKTRPRTKLVPLERVPDETDTG